MDDFGIKHEARCAVCVAHEISAFFITMSHAFFFFKKKKKKKGQMCDCAFMSAYVSV